MPRRAREKEACPPTQVRVPTGFTISAVRPQTCA